MEGLSIDNCWPGMSCKVVNKPDKWEGDCRFVGQVGHCIGTDHKYGAKLKFTTGEMMYFAFKCLEVVPTKPQKSQAKEKPAEPEKHKSYKVIKKPAHWNSHCKFINQVGVCIAVDDRGARLRFASGADVSFPMECIEECSPIDINSLASNVELNEDSVVVGNLYRVTKKPEKWGKDAECLVGKIGKAKWTNYRGVCLRFDDGSGYLFEFDSVERYIPPTLPNPVNVPKKLSANTMVIGRTYKVVRVADDWTSYEKQNILDKMGVVVFCSDVSRGAMMRFMPSKIEKLIPFDYIQDLPRPTEEELIELIKKQPGRILKIIKSLNKMTKLKPVKDFVENGELPIVEAPELLGPPAPMITQSEACLPQTVGEASDDMLNRVVTMFNNTDYAG